MKKDQLTPPSPEETKTDRDKETAWLRRKADEERAAGGYEVTAGPAAHRCDPKSPMTNKCANDAAYMKVADGWGLPARLCEQHYRDVARNSGNDRPNYVSWPNPNRILPCMVDLDDWGPSPAPHLYGTEERAAIVKFMRAQHETGVGIEAIISRVEAGDHLLDHVKPCPTCRCRVAPGESCRCCAERKSDDVPLPELD